jgi:hypothetical protein
MPLVEIWEITMIDCSDCGEPDERATTYLPGCKQVCETCRWWSERCAQALGAGPIEALCLAQDGPKSMNYTRANDTCPAWRINSHGAIDDPYCGEDAVARYAQEDEENEEA